MKRWLFLFFCLPFLLFAQEEKGPSLEGILLLGSWKDFHSTSSEKIVGAKAQGVVFIDRNPYFLKDLEFSYLGRPITPELIHSVQERVSAFYQAQNQLYTYVIVPQQNTSNGVLQVIVQEVTLGSIRTRGNEYVKGSELASYIRTKQGEVIVETDLLEDLAWMNQNAFRRTDARFVPGEKPGTADLELLTIDRWPYRVYTGVDNTGTISTERERLVFGFNFSQSYIPNSEVSYQFTCSPNWNRFFAHTVSTRVPCPWRHTFLFWGGYAQDEPELDAPGEKSKGVNWQVDGRYRIPILEVSTLMQTLVVGYDFKETHNRIRVNGVETFNETADINQFMLGYELGFTRNKQKATLIVEAYGNPGGITTKNHRKEYEKFRFNARAAYAYLTVAQSYAIELPEGWGFHYDFSGQVSSANLLATEQINLSGELGVRGFEERILLLDNGALLKVEFETPHWNLAKRLGSKKFNDALYFLAFFDGGVGANHQRAQNEKKFKGLCSVGPGVRYQFGRYVMARFDYGVQLWHRGFFNPTHSRYNVGLLVSY